MSVVIDAKAFRGLDFGIGPKPPPFSPASFGPVIYLTCHRHWPEPSCHGTVLPASARFMQPSCRSPDPAAGHCRRCSERAWAADGYALTGSACTGDAARRLGAGADVGGWDRLQPATGKARRPLAHWVPGKSRWPLPPLLEMPVGFARRLWRSRCQVSVG